MNLDNATPPVVLEMMLQEVRDVWHQTLENLGPDTDPRNFFADAARRLEAIATDGASEALPDGPPSGPNVVLKSEQVSADVTMHTYYELTDEQAEQFAKLPDKWMKDEFLSDVAESHFDTEVGSIQETLDLEFTFPV